MSGNTNLNMNHNIEAAFRKLNLPKEKESNLRRAIESIFMICIAPKKPASPSFRDVGKNRTDLELKKLVNIAKQLAQHLDSLHAPAIQKLADLGFHEVRITLPPLLNKIAKAVQEEIIVKIDKNPPDSSNVTETGMSNQDLHRKQITLADDNKSAKGGRPINHHANAIAGMLSHHYHELTEKEPTIIIDAYSKTPRASGPFLELVTSVFKAAGIRSNAEHAARLAIDARKNGTEKT